MFDSKGMYEAGTELAFLSWRKRLRPVLKICRRLEWMEEGLEYAFVVGRRGRKFMEHSPGETYNIPASPRGEHVPTPSSFF